MVGSDTIDPIITEIIITVSFDMWDYRYCEFWYVTLIRKKFLRAKLKICCMVFVFSILVYVICNAEVSHSTVVLCMEKAYVVNPCDSCNTDVNTPLNAIRVHV